MAEHRIQLGDEFRIAAFSSVVVQMRARVLIEFDNGKLREFNVKLTTTSDRLVSSATFGNLEANGRVVRAIVARITPSSIKRGQCYVILNVRDRNGVTVDQLAGDYLFETNNLSLDRHENARSGRGHLAWRTVADDIAPVDITDVLAVANAFRRVYGYVWYYHCSDDVSNRTLVVAVRAPGLSLPTGFAISEVVGLPHTAAITVSANEEGILYAMGGRKGSGFASTNDNTTLVASNTASAPSPLPLDVEENDLVELFFDVGNPDTDDRHSIFILQEEWIEV